jgi:hypothetical protein
LRKEHTRQKSKQKRRKAGGCDFPMIQVIDSGATTLSGMLNPYKYAAMPQAGVSACDQFNPHGAFGAARPDLVRKARIGSLSSRPDYNCLTERRLRLENNPGLCKTRLLTSDSGR